MGMSLFHLSYHSFWKGIKSADIGHFTDISWWKKARQTQSETLIKKLTYLLLHLILVARDGLGFVIAERRQIRELQ